MKRVLGFILKSFLQGLVILGPIGVTVYAVFFVFLKLDNLLPFTERFGTGVGALSVVVIITLVGYLGTRFLLGRWLVQIFDYLLEHTPGIKFIYTSIKDILGSFVGDKRKFNQPVWVRVSDTPEVLRVGFLTQEEVVIAPGAAKVAVYLPHSYAISGWVIVVDKDAVTPVENMTAAEAMKFAVSGGITTK